MVSWAIVAGVWLEGTSENGEPYRGDLLQGSTEEVIKIHRLVSASLNAAIF